MRWLLAAIFIFISSAGHCQTLNEIDVVWIKGQSNAAPNSESLTTSPKVPAGKVLKYQDTTLSDANDPVGIGRGIGGSAWPSFGKTYFELTGRQLCFVPTAVASSAMVSAADIGAGDWSETGTLNAMGLAAYRAAIAALTGRGYTIGRQFIIDVQGETDGFAIDDKTITAGQFLTAKKAMIARDRASLGIPDLPFYFSLLGRPNKGPTPGWTAVQQAQRAICATDPPPGSPSGRPIPSRPEACSSLTMGSTTPKPATTRWEKNSHKTSWQEYPCHVDRHSQAEWLKGGTRLDGKPQACVRNSPARQKAAKKAGEARGARQSKSRCPRSGARSRAQGRVRRALRRPQERKYLIVVPANAGTHNL